MQIVLDGKFAADRSVLALGMFDGVHIGHSVLLKKARALADHHRTRLVVCTFLEHPLALISPEKCPPMLTTFQERAALMEEMGVDVLYAMPFDHEVMDMPPADYVGHLVRRFHPAAVVCGYNHTFGKKGEGTCNLLSALGLALGFETVVVPKITLDGQEVSSTAIRAALGRADVAYARKLLGRPYRRKAVVAERAGDRVTLHLPPCGKQDLPKGTYRATCTDGEKTYPISIHVLEDGRAVCALPENCAMGDGWLIRFWHNLSVDF